MDEQQPSGADVEQYEEPELSTVPVDVQGPVRTQDLPSVTQGIGQVSLDTTGSRILAPDMRRKMATILSLDENMVLSHSQAGLVNGATWLQNVPLVLGTADEVWAKSSTGTTELSIIIEGWAT